MNKKRVIIALNTQRYVLGIEWQLTNNDNFVIYHALIPMQNQVRIHTNIYTYRFTDTKHIYREWELSSDTSLARFSMSPMTKLDRSPVSSSISTSLKENPNRKSNFDSIIFVFCECAPILIVGGGCNYLYVVSPSKDDALIACTSMFDLYFQRDSFIPTPVPFNYYFY